jgi:two-component system OmpR family sensor kinase
VPRVLGDENQLYRLLSNLLDNAIKNTPANGQVALRVGAAKLSATPAAVLEVADTGAGIAAEHLPHVFGRFYRADAGRPLVGGHRPGSGLGLALVQSIVTAHHGQVSLASVPGQGTTVRVVLPSA